MRAVAPRSHGADSMVHGGAGGGGVLLGDLGGGGGCGGGFFALFALHFENGDDAVHPNAVVVGDELAAGQRYLERTAHGRRGRGRRPGIGRLRR